MEDENSNVSQNAGDSEEVQYEEMGNIREMFGLPEKVEAKAEEDSDDSVKDDTPAIEDVKTESSKRVVKFNKEDREIDESEVDGLLQKGLALDKERERKSELEKTLERVAKLDGVSVTDYLANLDKKEADAVQKEKNAYNDLRKELREEAADAGLDPDKLEAYLDNHPVMKEAQKAIQERDASKADSETRNFQDNVKSQWEEVFSAFPDIEKRDITFNGSQVVFLGEVAPDWLTPEVLSRLNSGYKPMDVFTLSNMNKIQTQTKKQSEQKAIKDLQLGNRSQVETIDKGTQEKQVSEELRGAFSLFGIDPKRAQKYAK